MGFRIGAPFLFGMAETPSIYQMLKQNK